jgi:DNA-binding MarR family transcriptional regulator
MSTSPTGGPRISGLLNLAWDEAFKRMNADVGPRHPTLRPAHLQLFRFGSIDDRRITELAAREGMTKQSMHELIRHLERNGYVRTEPDPADARAHVVRLTESGEGLEADVIASSAGLHLRWAEELGADLFNSVWQGLQQMLGREGGPPDLDDLRRRAARL